MNKNQVFLAVASSTLFAGCATPHVVQSVKQTDQSLTCNQIDVEMAEADRFRAEAQKEKGFTGTNVAAAIFFWPAIFGTYSNANDAITAADARRSNLANIYAQKKCTEIAQSAESGRKR